MIGIPERHRVEESLGIVVLELQIPGCAGIGGFVNARSRTIADAEYISRPRIKGVNVAKVERVSCYRQPFPRRAAVSSPQHRTAGAAGPRHTFTYRAYAAQPGRDSAGLQPPLGRSYAAEEQCGCDCEQTFHKGD